MSARRHGPPRPTRRAFGTAAALMLVGAASACTDDDQLNVEFVAEAPATQVLPGGDPAQTALTLSALIVETADGVVIATEDSLEALAAVSASARLPLLVGTDQVVVEEIDRLGARTLVVAEGTDVSGLGENLDLIEIDPADADAADLIPEASVEEQPAAVSVFLDPAEEGPVSVVARALVEAAGGAVALGPGADPRATGETVAAAKEAVGQDPAAGAIAIGEGFGDLEQFTRNLQTAITVPELPGGGQVAFPYRRMVAAYGSPGIPSLGVLGEQDLEGSIERVQELAAEYEDYTEVPVIPAFEVIATIASDAAGADGNHSTELGVETIREWVDAAGQAGVYVVLDLQPGTTDFLTQAKLYEELFLLPHVGLALDAEWRLAAGQRHLEQIGSVSGAEVNETAQWLADLTAEHDLPQKVFILHQFSLAMISDRQDIDASRPELAMVLHADGHGTPGDKLSTWSTLQQDLPEGIGMAWKNFYDEDTPTFTPEETYDLEPRPWFVSYQ